MLRAFVLGLGILAAFACTDGGPKPEPPKSEPPKLEPPKSEPPNPKPPGREDCGHRERMRAVWIERLEGDCKGECAK